MTEIDPADTSIGSTYNWTDPEHTSLRRISPEGNVAVFVADPQNSDYQRFLASGEQAAPYVAPPEPEPETTEQKVNRLLSDYGLTREEMQAALAAK